MQPSKPTVLRGSFPVLLGTLLLMSCLTTLAQVPVRVEQASTRAVIRQINVTGTVTSPRTAVLSTAVAGLVSELTIDEGHRVDSGDVLLRLDPELAQLALERALAEVRQQETALADSRRRFVEADKLGSQRGIARTQVESLRAEVANDEAALAASVAAAREQEAIVARHALKAPFAGVINARLAELGEWVSPGNGVLELVATDNLRFDFRVGQENYAVLSLATPVEISLDAVPGQMIPGRVDTIVPVKNPSARTFLIRVLALLPEVESAGSAAPSIKITPGMSARAKLNIDSGRRGVTVSRDAILRYPDGRSTVWVVAMADGQPQVRERLVRTGSEFDGLVEVVNGLADGELVVVRGNETLQDGQSVSLLDQDP